MTIRDLLAAANTALVTISRDGETLQLAAASPEKHTIPPALIETCRARKPELLAYLRFAEQADKLLLASTERLWRACPPGCTALDDDPGWDDLKAQVRGGYWSQDLDQLREVLRCREGYALQCFACYQRERQP